MFFPSLVLGDRDPHLAQHSLGSHESLPQIGPQSVPLFCTWKQSEVACQVDRPTDRNIGSNSLNFTQLNELRNREIGSQ